MLDRLQFGFSRKLRLILQTEAAECGLASLAMVAGYHGYDTDLPSLRSRFAISLKGATLAQLMHVAHALGFQTRPVRLDLRDLEMLSTPCILHWDLKHFVVLQKARSDCLEILDPARGIRTIGHAEASRSFTGVALEMAPGMSFSPRKERQQLRLGPLLNSVSGLRPALIQVFTLAAALEVFGLVIPFFSQWVIDDVLVSGDADLLIVLMCGMLLIGLFQVIAGWVRGWILMHLTTTVNVQWLGGAFGHLLRLPMNWFEKRHLGDVVSRFGSISALQQTLTTGMVAGVVDGVMAVITLVVMLMYNAQLAAVAGAAVTIYAAVRIARYGALRRANAEQIVRAAKQQSHFMESVRGIQVIKLFNRQEERGRRFMNMSIETVNAALSVQRQVLSFGALNGFLVTAENAAILYLGARAVLGSQLSVGMLIAFLSYKGQFVSRAMALIDQILAFRMLGLQTERLADIVLAEPEAQGPVGETLSVRGMATSIEVRNVSFRYSPNDPWILRHVSMRIDEGESVAITGPSGCGKTTLLKILLGQLEPEEGVVLVGNVPLRQLGLHALRDLIGVVMQDDRLFAGSVGENISCFTSEVDQERIEESARVAAVDQDILRMPMGYNTLVGDMGSALSGGQRQRVILARALYKHPKLLLLDEATSHLDALNETLVNAAVQRLKITRIVVAHREQTLAAMDRVVALQNVAAAAE